MAPSAVGPELVLSDTQKLKEKSIAADTKYQTIPAPFPDLLSPSHQDFRADLARDGYVVIKNAIPHDRAVAYQEKAYAWLKSFPGALDFNDPSTWTAANLPLTNYVGGYAYYCVSHERFIWEAKQEQGVLDTFATLWGTDELLVSFDALNVTFPNRRDVERRKPWEHIDQSPLRRGVHCVQGLLNLSPSGPDDGGLTALPGSHRLNEEFFDSRSDQEKEAWLPMKDVYLFSPDELAWFKARGIEPLKVCAEVGDLILWDSRTIHYGAEPTEKSSQIRTAIYATYTPAGLGSKEQMELKKQAFEAYAGTTHWPHQYIVARPSEVLLKDGTRDPRNRDKPLEEPVRTEKLLKLAGATPY